MTSLAQAAGLDQRTHDLLELRERAAVRHQVRSVGYRLSFFLILAMRPRDSDVHMDSSNHDRMPRSSFFKKPLKKSERGRQVRDGT